MGAFSKNAFAFLDTYKGKAETGLFLFGVYTVVTTFCCGLCAVKLCQTQKYPSDKKKKEDAEAEIKKRKREDEAAVRDGIEKKEDAETEIKKREREDEAAVRDEIEKEDDAAAVSDESENKD